MVLFVLISSVNAQVFPPPSFEEKERFGQMYREQRRKDEVGIRFEEMGRNISERSARLKAERDAIYNGGGMSLVTPEYRLRAEQDTQQMMQRIFNRQPQQPSFQQRRKQENQRAAKEAQLNRYQQEREATRARVQKRIDEENERKRKAREAAGI